MEARLREVVEQQFDRYARQIAKGLKRGGDLYDAESVKEMIYTRKAFIVPGRNAMVIVRIETYPKGKLLNFWLSLGDMRELWEIEASLSDWAEKAGMRGVKGHGSRGWGKLIEGLGYRPFQVTYLREF